MTLQTRHIFLIVAILVCLVFSVAMASYALYTNEEFGFPLDDPWIHLQFARNLSEYGSFSYYHNEMVTSGSTAPLYTLMLGAGFFVTRDEMMLSYVLGVAFFLAGIAYFFRIAEHLFPGKAGYAFLGTLLFALEPRLHWIALSGMETTLFILLSLASFLYYRIRKPVALGVATGLLVWTRPEAVILVGAILADILYAWWLQKKRRVGPDNPIAEYSWLLRGLAVLAIFGVAYAAFNLVLSGSVLPNTYAAKVKYYTSGGKDFPAEVFRYLTKGHLVVFSLISAAGILQTLISILRGRQSDGLVPLLFTVGLFFAYWIKLPYLYQNGRYLMPVLPFILILGLMGFDWILTKSRSALHLTSLNEKMMATIRMAFLVYAVVHFAYGVSQERMLYQDYCQYINSRQVKTGHWIREHLPAEAAVATHDVGALAYYSERRIVDMVGLVSPGMIERIGDLNALKEFLREQGATHLAVLRNWFEVVNANPLFQTDETTPEIMEVFAFDPEKIHFTTGEVAWLTSTGWMHLARGDVRQGGPMLERAVQLDPQSSRAHHHLGWAFMMAGQPERADEEFRTAIGIHPEYWLAHFSRAQLSLRRNQPEEALKRLEQLLELNPKMLTAHQTMAQIFAQQGDTARARISLETYRRELEQIEKP